MVMVCADHDSLSIILLQTYAACSPPLGPSPVHKKMRNARTPIQIAVPPARIVQVQIPNDSENGGLCATAEEWPCPESSWVELSVDEVDDVQDCEDLP